jgi:hypothetical protein
MKVVGKTLHAEVMTDLLAAVGGGLSCPTDVP